MQWQNHSALTVSLGSTVVWIKEMTIFPAFVIVDVSAVHMTFSEMAQGLAEVALSEIGKKVVGYHIEIINIGTHDWPVLLKRLWHRINMAVTGFRR